MAYLDPKQAFADLKTNVVSGLQAHFPITGTKQSLHLESLDVREKDHDPGDLEAQHRAKVTGGSWTVPVFGTVALKNNETGDVIDRKTIKVCGHPTDDTQVQLPCQWQGISGG